MLKSLVTAVVWRVSRAYTSRISVVITVTYRSINGVFRGGGTEALVDGKLESFVTAIVRHVGRAHSFSSRCTSYSSGSFGGVVETADGAPKSFMSAGVERVSRVWSFGEFKSHYS